MKISYSVRVFNEWSHTSKNILSTINDFKRQQKLWHLYNSHTYFHQKYEMIKKKKENWIFDFEEKKIVFTWMTLFFVPDILLIVDFFAFFFFVFFYCNQRANFSRVYRLHGQEFRFYIFPFHFLELITVFLYVFISIL